MQRPLCWTVAFVLLALSPVLLLFLTAPIPGTGIAWDFAVALGFAVTGLLLLMFVLTARFRRLATPFGIDLIYYFHRQIAMGLLVLAVVHVCLLLATEPALKAFLLPSAPAHMLAGSLALLCLVLLVTLSLLRRRLGFRYEIWRRTHLLLAVLAVVASVLHVGGVNHYINHPLMQVVVLAALVVWVLLILRVRVLKPWRLSRRPWQVAAVVPEKGRAVSLTLKPQDHTGIRFQAGQFAWLTIGESPFAMAEHPFSIASSAEQSGTIGFTIKALGDFTSMVQTIRPGATVYVDGPFGVFSMDRVKADGLFFVAGGIGIVPIMSMLRTLAERCDGRSIILLYAANDLEGMTYFDELNDLVSRLQLTLVPVPCRAPAAWQGACGRVDPELLQSLLPAKPDRWHYFLCGPPPMMKMAESALHQGGVHYRQVHSELFNLV